MYVTDLPSLIKASHRKLKINEFSRCLAHVRCLSNVKPRYFIFRVIGIRLLLSDTEGKSPGLRENVIKDDFA